MARNRNPNRDAAYELYKNDTTLTPKKLADKLDENVRNIRTWKSQDKWDEKLGLKKNKRGAPRGNLNAIGNKGGAPEGNLNAFRDGSRIPQERFASKGFLAKYLPKATQKIMDDIHNSDMSSLDMLWVSIELQITTIVRSQKIMHVTSKNEIKKTLKSEETTPGKWGDSHREDYEVQFAWDRQERFVTAISKAFKTLNGLIKNYEELLHKNWEAATDEQKYRVEKLKCEVKKITGEDDNAFADDGFIKALEGKVDELWGE